MVTLAFSAMGSYGTASTLAEKFYRRHLVFDATLVKCSRKILFVVMIMESPFLLPSSSSTFRLY